MDSDILIWVLRGKEEIKEKLKKYVIEEKGFVFITPIQVTEVMAGVRKGEKEITRVFLESFKTLQIDDKAGYLAGEFLRKYRNSHGVTLSDAIIAATCKLNGCRLWTLNRKHYPMMGKDELVT